MLTPLVLAHRVFHKNCFEGRFNRRAVPIRASLSVIFVAGLFADPAPTFASCTLDYQGLTCEVEHPQNTNLTHYQVKGHSGKSQLLLWFEENFPSIPIAVNDLPFVKSVALLVGVGKYAHLHPLDFVENDLSEMLKWLLLEERFDDVYVLRDEDATPRSVNNLMFNFFPEVVGRQDRFLFYYSGHGGDIETKVGYLVFGNATNSFDQDTYLPAITWRQWSARLLAKEQLFLLDGCSLGLGVTAMDSPRDNEALLRGMTKDPGRLVFCATRGREDSYGSGKASYFTQEFLNAVRAEQQDPNSIGFTTIDKISAIMAPKLASLILSRGLSWYSTTPIPFDREAYPGTFVFVNPKVSQSSSRAVNFIERAVGKSSNVELPPSASPSASVTKPQYNTATDLQTLRMAAEKGEPEAMWLLGEDYETGRYVAQNFPEALKWYQRAANAGYSKAMVALGGMYGDGFGVSRDEAQMVKWYRKAADAGDSFGMGYLGDCYERGSGVTQDVGQAINWYQRAVNAGNSTVLPALKRLRSK